MRPLDKPVTSCGECQRLYRNAMNHRGDLSDTKKKLVKAQRFGTESRYVEAIAGIKANLTEIQDRYYAHHAQEHPRANAVAFGNLGTHYNEPPAELPPAVEMAAMLEDGWTRQDIADEYGCSVTTVAHRLQGSGFLDKKPEPEADLLDILTGSLWGAEWMRDGLCAQTDPDSFFPDKGKSNREAKQVCMSCPVRAECLEAALERNERFGVWGGMSERERRRVLRKRESEEPGEPIETPACANRSCEESLPVAAPPSQKYCSRNCAARAGYERKIASKPKTDVA